MGFSVGNIVGLAIGIYIFAAIMPSAISDLFGVNQSGWSTSTQTIWDLLGLIIVAGFARVFYKLASD